jgi:hypothetical protein
MNIGIYIVKVAQIHLGAGFKIFIRVPSRTKRALSNGEIRFSIDYTMEKSNSKYSFSPTQILIAIE